MDDCDDQCELQIDLGYGSRPEVKSSVGGTVEGQSAMTWLQAAEHVLREEGGPGMHIRELTRTILELGMVKSSCSTSLETLLYRQTSKGTSKFIRVPGKMGWFGLRPMDERKDEQEEEAPGNSRPVSQKPVAVQQMEHSLVVGGVPVDGRREEGDGWNFHPKVVYKRKKRMSECSGSGSDDSEWSSSSDEDSEGLYHKRYVFTKKMAKSIIYENVAMAEQLELIERKIATAEAERQFLLEKFMKFNQKTKLASVCSSKGSAAVMPTDGSVTATTKGVIKASGSTSFTGGSSAPPPLIPMSSVTTSTVSDQQTQLRELDQTEARTGGNASCLSALLMREVDTRVQSSGSGKTKSTINPGSDGRLGVVGQPAPQALVSGHSPLVSSSSSSSSSSEGEGEEDTTAVLGAEEAGSKTKGTRKKAGKKVRRLYSIPLNDDGEPLLHYSTPASSLFSLPGSPVLPIQIGGLRVHSLGKIVYDRPAYHSERYLLPVGFNSSRSYPSMLSPSRRTTYNCSILDGGDAPVFEMCAEDSPEAPVQATSSTACQSIVLKAINKARDRQATNSGSGPEFFGYSNPTILNLLQKLPNAGRCSKYKFIKFDSPVSSTPKTKTKLKTVGHGKQHKRKMEGSLAKKLRLTASPKPSHSGRVSVISVSDGRGTNVSHTSTPTDPSLAPVLGSGMSQFGLEAGIGLYSSSEEWSSSDTERELTVDL